MVRKGGQIVDRTTGQRRPARTAGNLTWLVVLTVLAVMAFGASVATAGGDPVGRRIIMLGRSVQGRAITAIDTGDLDSPQKTLVVGCIHGNECAGIPIAQELARTASPSEADVWIVPDLNPDGAAAGTRGNAHGVDLNRNFPWEWARLGGVYFSGPGPLSEPETRIAYRLITSVRPSVAIWFHQHLDLVDDSTGSVALERRFARAAGLRLAALAREPGSVVNWESHCFPRGSAFVVELPGGSLSAASRVRFVRAVSLAAALAPARRPVAVCKSAVRRLP